jgi:hypothetical protein
MEQLKMGQILKLASDLQKEGMILKEIVELPVYIGRDDELNGIHTAWYVEPIKPEEEEYKWMVEMINEDHCNVKIKGKAILIS